jgi:RNA polymerase sigma-70 factor (ECF subfamily)
MPPDPGSPRQERARLRRIASGDRRALAGLYETWGARLYGQVLWITRSRPEAEDVVQAVFVRIAGLGAELLRVRRPRAWLFRTAHNEAVDQLRRQRASRETSGEADLYEAAGLDAEERAEIAHLEERLAELPREQREAVYLHLYQGLTFREVGEATGVSTHTAASRYRLAIARLRRELGLG